MLLQACLPYGSMSGAPPPLSLFQRYRLTTLLVLSIYIATEHIIIREDGDKGYKVDDKIVVMNRLRTGRALFALPMVLIGHLALPMVLIGSPLTLPILLIGNVLYRQRRIFGGRWY